MNIIGKRIENVEFSRIVQGNESESLCNIPYEIVTAVVDGLKADGFASAEYPKEIIFDFVSVNGRNFHVGRSTSNMKTYWNSVTLPPGLDPRPSPREWNVVVSKGPSSDNEYIWDDRCVGDRYFNEKIRVREILNEP